MIALDSNILIYAHRDAVPEHGAARRAIELACDEPGGCGICFPVISEFWTVVTHPDA